MFFAALVAFASGTKCFLTGDTSLSVRTASGVYYASQQYSGRNPRRPCLYNEAKDRRKIIVTVDLEVELLSTRVFHGAAAKRKFVQSALFPTQGYNRC